MEKRDDNKEEIKEKIQRKRFVPVLTAACLAALGLAILFWYQVLQPKGGQQEPGQEVSATVFAMDTIITLETHDGRGEEALAAAEALIVRLEDLWSITKEESEIYQANHNQGTLIPISPETEELISYTLELADETSGALNPALYPIVQAWGFTSRGYRIPDEEELQTLLQYADYHEIELSSQTLTLPEYMEVDFGAVAKGYTGDLLVETLKEYGVTSGIINLGGNVALVGSRPDGTPWRVGIRNPYGEGNIGTLEASDSHIVTSGGYERYFTGEDGNTYWHILDPSDGAPAHSGIISSTIIGEDGRRSDGLSTAVFVMGLEQAVEYWQARGDFEMILVTEDNQVYITEGLDGTFQLNEASQGMPLHVITK